MPPYSLVEEGSNKLPSNLKFCIVAGADLRNAFTTVCHLQESFKGRVTMYVNDRDPGVVAKNFLILEMLRMYGHNGIDTAIALWYSSCLTSQQSLAVDEVVSSLLQSKASTNCSTNFSITTCFGESVWNALQAMHSSSWTKESALETRRKVTYCRPDLVEAKLAGLRPQHRVAYDYHRKSGMLLPFGYSDHSLHNCANKYILHPDLGWTKRDADEPLDGWLMQEILESGELCGVSRMNLYGCLFFHLRRLLTRFLYKLEGCQVRFKLFCSDARDLSSMFVLEGVSFQGIDTSNLADLNYVGIERILKDCGPLLKAKGEVSEPVLIVSFMNWYLEAEKLSPPYSDESAEVQRGKETMDLLLEGIKYEDFSLLVLFLNTTEMFQAFPKFCNVNVAARQAGLVARKMHKLVPKRTGAKLFDPEDRVPGSTLSVDEMYYLSKVVNSTLTERFMEWIPDV